VRLRDDNATPATAEAPQYQIRDLGSLGTQTLAASVNDDGIVAGWYIDDRDMRHAVVWRDWVVQQLAYPDSVASVAVDVNNSGAVVGEYETEIGDRFAYVW